MTSFKKSVGFPAAVVGIMSMLLIISFGNFSCGGGSKLPGFREVLELRDNWQLQSSAKIESSGVDISSPDFTTVDWYTVSVPTTVLGALVKNGIYKDVYYAVNFEKIPREPFQTSWWFRNQFQLEKIGPATRLIFNGINHKAEVWVNGQKTAGVDTMEGPFNSFDLDISGKVKEGKNVVAVEIFPPKKGDLTIGFVDWNPYPPDGNMGLWRGVQVKQSGAVSMNHVFVQPKVNTETLKEAWLTISAELKNHSIDIRNAVVSGVIGEIRFSQTVMLQPGESKKVVFTPENFSQLHLTNPKLWWPNNLGDPALYQLDMSLTDGGKLSDKQSVSFGIREVKDYINDEGHRGYMVNGKKILIRGGAWVDDMLLNNNHENIRAQMQYVKHMNLNTVRLEGFWGSDEYLYEQADQMGILLMVGLSCQWEWEDYCGRPDGQYMSVNTPRDIDVQARGYRDQVRYLRNHPSIFVWVYGSDKLPSPEFEKELNRYVTDEDSTRPVLGACKYKVFLDKSPLKALDEFAFQTSEITGGTRVKMLGAWDYEPPMYWFSDREFGGAYGFNTETGPGPQPVPLESLKKMIPQEHLWPINSYWDYHCGRNEFNTINRWLKGFNTRYWPAENVEEFSFNAQIANYELMRPMFEAFGAYKHNATGVIAWMLNSAWPEMYWQLYDYYLMPSGAFYGTRKACQPINIIYNYGEDNIYIANETHQTLTDLSAEIRILDLHSKEVYKKALTVGAAENSSVKILDMPPLEKPTSVYFLDLKLKDQKGQAVADNFYWLSTKKDSLDYAAGIWLHTPQKEYADFKGLKTLDQVALESEHKFETSVDGLSQAVTVNLKNSSEILAFFVELKVVGDKSGETVLPVYWSDNYVSLLPGESKTLTARYEVKDLNGQTPVFKYVGFNVKPL